MNSVVVGIVVASVLLMLVRPRGVAEVWWIGTGATLLVATGLVPVGTALAAVMKGADVYAFLAGMMLISELARAHGVFDWLAALSVGWARRSPARLFAISYGVGTVVTVFMSNDATAVVLTPAILAAVRRAKVAPLPYAFGCALIANAASFVLPISNPANLVVFGGRLPSLGSWLAAFAIPSVLAIGVTYVVIRVAFRKELTGTIASEPEPARLSRRGRWMLGGLGLMALVLVIASALEIDLGLPALAAATLVTAAVSVATRANPVRLVRAISWSTLLLVAGLFVMVEAVMSRGALAATTAALTRIDALPAPLAALASAFVVGFTNNVVNNLPLGLVTAATLHAAQPPALVAHAALIGVDLGPNLATTGSLATILWLIALRREGITVGFWSFFKIGAIAMPLALLAATLGLIATASLR